MKKLISISVMLCLVLCLFACRKAPDAAGNVPAGSGYAVEQEAEQEQTTTEPEEQASTPFGGSAFVFGCDDSQIRIPCTYNDFLAESGLELRDYEYAPDPDRNPVDDGRGFEENGMLYLPGGEMTADFYLDIAEYKLDENGGGKTYIKRNDEYAFQADTYGGGQVYMVFVNVYSWDDPAEAARFTFPCGAKLGMSADELHALWGEPYASEYKGDKLAEYFIDGLEMLVVGYGSNGTDSIELAYGQQFADQVLAK